MLRTKPLRGPRETFRFDRDLIRARCMHALGTHVVHVHAYVLVRFAHVREIRRQ